jgi:hypothetical protein
MVKSAELFILSKSGQQIQSFPIIGEDSINTQRTNQILQLLPPFIKGLNFPKSTCLFRVEKTEVRFCTGQFIYVVLFIECNIPLSLMTEPILAGLMGDIIEKFEEKNKAWLEKGETQKIPSFSEGLDAITEKYGFEAFEIYQKMLLTEAMYEKIPQDICLPLMERVAEGDDVIEDLKKLPERWLERLKNAVVKVNFEAEPIWEIFAIPILKDL